MVGRIPESVEGLFNSKELYQPPLPTSVLMRLKSVIVFLTFFQIYLSTQTAYFHNRVTLI